MSATMVVARQPHTAVHRVGPRPGSVHAALLDGGAWATACGERLTDSARGRMAVMPLGAALALIALESPRLCARCDRAGSTVAS